MNVPNWERHRLLSLEVGEALVEIELRVLTVEVLLELGFRSVAEERRKANFALDVHRLGVSFQLASLARLRQLFLVSRSGRGRLLCISATHRKYLRTDLL